MSEHELHHDDNKLITQRREKLAVLREQGVPFPNDVVREHKAADLQTHTVNTRSRGLKKTRLKSRLQGA